MVFHWLVEPTVKSQPVAAYESSGRTVQPSGTAFVVRSEPASRVTAKARTSSTATTAAPEMTGSVRSQTSRVTSNPSGSTPPSIMAPEFKQAARSEPPPLWVVRKPGTSAAANTSKSSGQEAPMWVVSKPATPAPATEGASASTEPARADPPSPAASETPSAAFAAVESTDAAATEPKKSPKKPRKTVRHERPSREFWNPWKFFASGSYGRPSF